MIDYSAFEVLTFDCYGTLIDWEAGIVAALRAELGDAISGRRDEELLAAFAAVEHEAEVPYKRYREVLEIAIGGVGERLGVPVDPVAVFPGLFSPGVPASPRPVQPRPN